MVSSIIDKQWMTKQGYLATITIQPNGIYCGYVAIPKHHPANGLQYYGTDIPLDEITEETYKTVRIQQQVNKIQVHGGLTFADKSWFCDYYMFGFDYAHCDDGSDYKKAKRLFGDRATALLDGNIPTVDQITRECNNLSKQLSLIKE